MSATNAHVGDILRPKQKTAIPIVQIITKILSMNGKLSIEIAAIRQPQIIGVKRENTGLRPFLIRRSESIPPSITDTIPEINAADVAIPICDKLSPFTLTK